MQISDQIGRVLHNFSTKLLVELTTGAESREENRSILSCVDQLGRAEATHQAHSETSRMQSSSHHRTDFEHHERPTKKHPEHYENKVDRLLNTYQKAVSQDRPDRDVPAQAASSNRRDARSPDQPPATQTTRKPPSNQSKTRDLESEVDFETNTPLASK